MDDKDDKKHDKNPDLHHVAVRLDAALQAQLDALRPKLSTPHHEATQSDVLRAVILAGLAVLEKEHGAKA